ENLAQSGWGHVGSGGGNHLWFHPRRDASGREQLRETLQLIVALQPFSLERQQYWRARIDPKALTAPFPGGRVQAFGFCKQGLLQKIARLGEPFGAKQIQLKLSFPRPALPAQQFGVIQSDDRPRTSRCSQAS